MNISKKVLAALMAVLMLFSISAIAFAEDPEPCDHSDTAWRIDWEATAEHDGQKSRVCTGCGQVVETQTFAQHTHVEGSRKTLVAPHCETTGEVGICCAICNAVYMTETLPALGHTGTSTVSVVGGSLEVVFLIDESGSMSWNDRDGIRKDVAVDLTDKLGTSDKAAVVAFDSGARVLCSFTSDKDVIKNAIAAVGDNGGTDMYHGLRTAMSLFDSPAASKRFVILLTDGESSGSFDYATAAADKGVVIYTVGLGSGVNEAELETIATTTGGKYFFASVAEDLFEIYQSISEEITTGGGTWVTTITPTCHMAGERVCYCTRCGLAIASQAIEPTAHVYASYVYTNEESHTCTCINCGQVVTERHDWSAWEFNNNNTFFRNGTKTRYCDGCGKTEVETAKHTSVFARIFYPPYAFILGLFNRIPTDWETV